MKKILLPIIILAILGSNDASGQYWSALGGGIGHPYSVPYNDGTLTGSDGPVTGPPVASLCFYKGELYAAGFFDFANGPANNIARWNGSNWVDVGNGVYTEGGGGLDSWVNVLFVHNEELYVAGRFTNAGKIRANNIAKWNGIEWLAVGDGLGTYGNSVSSLAIFQGELYAGGYFTQAGKKLVNNIAKWDGTNWSQVGRGIDVYEDLYRHGTVASMIIHNGELFACGYFGSSSIDGSNNILKWDGNNWIAVGTGIQNMVYSLASYNGQLYAGTDSTLYKWDGSTWSPLSLRINGPVYHLLVENSSLIVGGNFDSAGNIAARNIAKWNGTHWKAFGDGVDNSVTCMVATNGDYFIGGNFNTAGAVTANRIAKWTAGCSSVPKAPGSIIGSPDVCLNRYSEFLINPVTDASDYTWTLPSGWSGNSVSNKIRIFPGAAAGTIAVTANNPCGSSVPQIIYVNLTDTIISDLDSIAGYNIVCPKSTQTYSITKHPSATLYEWILPIGWEGKSITNTISVKTGTDGGVIAVRAKNHCSISNSQTMAIATKKTSLAQPGPVNGDDVANVGQTVVYSVAPVSASIGYSWMLSGGGNMISGQNTNTLSINWITTGTHVLTVWASDSCGVSVEQTKTITVRNKVNSENPYGLKIHPNPSSGKFYIQGEGVENKFISIEVINMIGQLAYPLIQMRGSSNFTHLIDIERLPKASYLVRITVNNKTFVNKISKIN